MIADRCKQIERTSKDLATAYFALSSELDILQKLILGSVLFVAVR